MVLNKQENTKRLLSNLNYSIKMYLKLEMLKPLLKLPMPNSLKRECVACSYNIYILKLNHQKRFLVLLFAFLELIVSLQCTIVQLIL